MTEPKGPASWENWKAQRRRQPRGEGYEVPLFTDCRITGELTSGFGPYQFFNPVAISLQSAELKPRMVMRVWSYDYDDPSELLRMDKTDTERYHGGWVDDEMASLAHLRQLPM